MKDYLKSKLVWLGLLMMMGPPMLIIIIVKLGLVLPPELIFFGLQPLGTVSFWLGLIVLYRGIARVWNSKRKGGK